MIEIEIPLLLIGNITAVAVLLVASAIGYYILKRTLTEKYYAGLLFLTWDIILVISTILVILMMNRIIEITVVVT